MFSTGMPLLYPFAMIFYIVLFCVYKLLLLKYYQTTNRFNEQLPIQAVGHIKTGLFFHLFIGSLMISNSEMIPDSEGRFDDEEYQLPEGMEEYEENEGVALLLRLPGRLWRTEHSRLYVLLVALLCACILLKKTLLQALVKCFAGLQALILDEDDDKEPSAYSRDIYKELVIQSLDDLHEKALTEQREFQEAVPNFANDNDYNEFRYEEETQFNSEKIKESH